MYASVLIKGKVQQSYILLNLAIFKIKNLPVSSVEALGDCQNSKKKNTCYASHRSQKFKQLPIL